MNPVTRSILNQVKDPRLHEFVEFWDALEGWVITAYKGKTYSAEDQAEYRRVREWLLAGYSRYEAVMEPYWRQTRAGGEPLAGDPFRFLLDISDLSGFVNNWAAMQHLPAARESLNNFLLDRVEK